jgi:hypothetical protein
MRLHFIFQSLEQAKTCFGDKATTILDNINTQVFFGLRSFVTAEEISKRCGDETVRVQTGGSTSGGSTSSGSGANPQSSSSSTSRSVNYSEIARKLLKPEEVLTIDKNICIIFHDNLPVTLGRLVKFFEAAEFSKRWIWWGPRGTAAPRRIGLAAALLSAFTLAASCVVVTFSLTMTGVIMPMRRALPVMPDMLTRIQAMTVTGFRSVAPTRPTGSDQDASPAPAGSGQAGPARKPSVPIWQQLSPRQRSKMRARKGSSGFLIKIQ